MVRMVPKFAGPVTRQCRAARPTMLRVSRRRQGVGGTSGVGGGNRIVRVTQRLAGVLLACSDGRAITGRS
jgi:hypothetical protein